MFLNMKIYDYTVQDILKVGKYRCALTKMLQKLDKTYHVVQRARSVIIATANAHRPAEAFSFI